ncbi:MAG TPA: hypothetical protein VHX44_19980 [Planctomycetota bacterium]|jgi:hypothetical protein|nr:hypothetical protein [Planctomycetota bacterium]
MVMEDDKLANEVLRLTSNINTESHSLFRPLSLALMTLGFIGIVASAFAPVLLGPEAQHGKPIFGRFDVIHGFLGSTVVVFMGVMFKLCHVIGAIKIAARRGLS